ncbi:hypothetical protein KJ611_00670 [Patescibacteria group bacterium]|nr:hypothetical protein [Patescibacteria group bacterium]MBU1705107.1 hypothetical protein [Patescibacteria group bacterium]
MPQVILRRNHAVKEINPLPIPESRPWPRTLDDAPVFDAAALNNIEYCVGCGEKMTVARMVAWLLDGQGTMQRRGPCHPNCRDAAQRRFPNHQLTFHHPNFVGKPTA